MVRHRDIIAQQYDIVWGYLLLMEEISKNSQDRNIPWADSIYYFGVWKKVGELQKVGFFQTPAFLQKGGQV